MTPADEHLIEQESWASRKRVLITGMGSGIGKAVMGLFDNPEWQVGVWSRMGQVCVWSRMDSVSVLVLCAGGASRYVHYSEASALDFRDMYRLNVVEPFELIQQVLPGMRARKWGRIVYISTTAVEYCGPNSLPYAASKAAMEVVLKGIARDVAKDNVLVNTIRCGVIDTPMRTRIEGYTEEQYQKRVALCPMGRAGTAEEVARTVLHLAGPGGDYITGTTITIAGGD